MLQYLTSTNTHSSFIPSVETFFYYTYVNPKFYSSFQGANNSVERVKKSEIESILNLLDVESDRILQGYSGAGVLYGGMQDDQSSSTSSEVQNKVN